MSHDDISFLSLKCNTPRGVFHKYYVIYIKLRFKVEDIQKKINQIIYFVIMVLEKKVYILKYISKSVFIIILLLKRNK